jgi:hypothetical protein
MPRSACVRIRNVPVTLGTLRAEGGDDSKHLRLALLRCTMHDDSSTDYVPLRSSGTYRAEIAGRGLAPSLRAGVLSIAAAVAVGQASYWLTLRYVTPAAERGSPVSQRTAAASRGQADGHGRARELGSNGDSTTVPALDAPTFTSPNGAALAGSARRLGANGVALAKRNVIHPDRPPGPLAASASHRADNAPVVSRGAETRHAATPSTRSPTAADRSRDAIDAAELTAKSAPSSNDSSVATTAVLEPSAAIAIDRSSPPSAAGDARGTPLVERAPTPAVQRSHAPTPLIEQSPNPSAPLAQQAKIQPPPEPAALRVTSEVLHGALPSSAIRRAVERIRPGLSACFSPPSVRLHRLSLRLQIDELGRVRQPQVEGAESPALTSCLIGVVNHMVSVAPDTGTVSVRLTLDLSA